MRFYIVFSQLSEFKYLVLNVSGEFQLILGLQGDPGAAGRHRPRLQDGRDDPGAGALKTERNSHWTSLLLVTQKQRCAHIDPYLRVCCAANQSPLMRTRVT